MRPFADTRALRAAFQDAMLTGSAAEQQLLDSFPDLGPDADDASRYGADHAAAGLLGLEDEDRQAVHDLALAYRRQFGFPLIACAQDLDRHDRLLATGWARLLSASVVERAAALIEIAKIANRRFDSLVADANPIETARVRRFADARAH